MDEKVLISTHNVDFDVTVKARYFIHGKDQMIESTEKVIKPGNLQFSEKPICLWLIYEVLRTFRPIQPDSQGGRCRHCWKYKFKCRKRKPLALKLLLDQGR